MSIAHDASSVSSEATGNLSWTHTPVGTPKGAVVVVLTEAGTAQITSVSYGGTAMTQQALSPFAGTQTVSCWFLGSSVPAGAQTALVTVSGSASKIAMAATLTAGGDTAVEDTSTNTATQTSGSSGTGIVQMTTSVTTQLYGAATSDDNFFCSLHSQDTAVDEGLRADGHHSSLARSTSTRAAGTPSLGWTTTVPSGTSTRHYGFYGVAIKEVAAAPTNIYWLTP